VGVLQQAVQALVYTASGFSYSWLAGASPLEAVVTGELMDEATSRGPQWAGVLAETIMDSIDELIDKEIPREGLATFKEIYDLKSIEPKPDSRLTLDRSREKLISLGAPLK